MFKTQEISTDWKRHDKLVKAYLDRTAIEELPPSIKRVTGLTLLNLQDCKNLLTDDEGGKITEFSFPVMLLRSLLNLEDCKNLLTDDEGGKISEFSFPVMLLQNLLNLEDCKDLLTDDEGGKITEFSFLVVAPEFTES